MPPRRSTRPPAQVSAGPYSRANDARSVSSPTSLSHTPDHEQSLKITIKAPPNKLRQATSGTSRTRADPYEDEQAPAGRSVRSTRNPRAVVEPDSDDEMDEDEAELEGEIDDDEEEEDEEDEEDDAEGEEDEDELAESHPPPPRIQQSTTAQGKPRLKISGPREGPLKSVEAKEVEDEDEELSDVDSDDEIQNTTAMDLDEDDEELDEEDEEDEEDAEGDDDSELGSGSATPDLSKLTRRQRGEADDFDGGLMALSNEAKSKKQISAEEHVMRRAEMARRRKNLSEKRNEEEKIDTINKLLKKPAPKRRTRAEILAAQAANGSTPGADDDSEDIKPDPVFTRWVNNASGSRIGVPVEWLETPAAAALA